MKNKAKQSAEVNDLHTTKLTPEQLAAEIRAICGKYPGEDMSVGPEGKCPACIGVHYTGSPLCQKHLAKAREGMKS